MGLNSRHFLIADLPEIPTEVMESFNSLPEDPYCENRYRRFSQYRAFYVRDRATWDVAILPHRPLIQSRKHNAYGGGVLRHFEPLTLVPLPIVAFVAESIDLDALIEWQVDFHQWRTTCQPGQASLSVPEGPHQDGHHYVAVLVLDRKHIKGGQTYLYTLDTREAFLEITIGPKQAIMFDDRKMMHFTDAICAQDDYNGHRDIMVISMSPWDEKRYGTEFETAATV
jgi:hypothetical protein